MRRPSKTRGGGEFYFAYSRKYLRNPSPHPSFSCNLQVNFSISKLKTLMSEPPPLDTPLSTILYVVYCKIIIPSNSLTQNKKLFYNGPFLFLYTECLSYKKWVLGNHSRNYGSIFNIFVIFINNFIFLINS